MSATMQTDATILSNTGHQHLPHEGVLHFGPGWMPTRADVRAERACIRRDSLLTRTKHYATAARRSRNTGPLRDLRHIGAQLVALNPASAEAWDVLNACSISLAIHRTMLQGAGAL